jgi:hypothetical protein
LGAAFFAAGFLVATVLTSFPWSQSREPNLLHPDPELCSSFSIFSRSITLNSSSSSPK